MSWGKEVEASEIIRPQGATEKYLKMVEFENIVANWYHFINGKIVKTRSFELFLTESNGTYFVYFFG